LNGLFFLNAGNVTSIGGNKYKNYADGMGTNALFNAPSGLSVDLDGNIYVADNGNDRIRKISPSGALFGCGCCHPLSFLVFFLLLVHRSGVHYRRHRWRLHLNQHE
jgi:hypothetical protein